MNVDSEEGANVFFAEGTSGGVAHLHYYMFRF
jgi:hypothetical protein